MILFGSLCITLCFFGVWTVSKKPVSRKTAVKLFLIVSFAVLLIISGCRGLAIGNDTPMYVRFFRRLHGLSSISVLKNRFEFLYRLYNCLIAQFFNDPHALLLITSALTLGLIFRAIEKKSAVPVLSVLMFTGLTFYYDSMCIMRQYIAIALIIWAICSLEERRWIRFIILTVAAGLFHTSAYTVLILLPISVIPFRKESRYKYLLIGLLVAVGYNVILSVFVRLMPAYANYLTSDKYYLQGALGSVMKVLVFGSLFLVFDYCYGKYGEDTVENKIQYFTALLGFFVILASVRGAVLSRIALYFNTFFCISVPNALSWIPNRNNKYIFATVILSGCYLYNFIILIFRPNWAGVIPYVFWG